MSSSQVYMINMVSWLLPSKTTGTELLQQMLSEIGPIYRAAPNRVLVNDSALAHEIYNWERAIFNQPVNEAWGGVFLATQEGSNKAHDAERKRLTPAVWRFFVLLLAET